MGFLDDLKRKLEAKKEEELKKLQDKKDEMLKKVPILGDEIKAREEAERKLKEEADRRAREEAERKARLEAERKAKEEAERKAKEESERKTRLEAERKAKEEAERKAKEDAERKAKEEAERKAKEDATLGEVIPKAESGDAQAACQLGMWFQHGENGITKNIEKAIYWYQKAAMYGNQAALTFLNMALEEKKSNEKKEAEEQAKRAQYETEDEYLANEKNDPEAAVRCVNYFKKLSSNYLRMEQYEKQLSCLKQALFYGRLYSKLGGDEIDTEGIEMQIDLVDTHIKTLRKKQEYLEKIEDTREISRREEERRQMKEENTVRVRFSADFYFTDYAGKHDRSDYWNREITKEEYNALLAGGTHAVANYIRSNLLDTRVFPKDSVITRATMQKM